MWVTLLSLLVDDYTGDGGADSSGGSGAFDVASDGHQDHQTHIDDAATADANSCHYHNNHNYNDDDDNDDDYDDNGEDKDEMGYPNSTNVLNFPSLSPLPPGTLIEHIQGLDTLALLLDSPHASRVRGAARMVQTLLQVNTHYCHFIRKYQYFLLLHCNLFYALLITPFAFFIPFFHPYLLPPFFFCLLPVVVCSRRIHSTLLLWKCLG